jgi:hypothetical protein
MFTVYIFSYEVRIIFQELDFNVFLKMAPITSRTKTSQQDHNMKL